MPGSQDLEGGHRVAKLEGDFGLAIGQYENRLPEEGLREIGANVALAVRVQMGELPDNDGLWSRSRGFHFAAPGYFSSVRLKSRHALHHRLRPAEGFSVRSRSTLFLLFGAKPPSVDFFLHLLLILALFQLEYGQVRLVFLFG